MNRRPSKKYHVYYQHGRIGKQESATAYITTDKDFEDLSDRFKIEIDLERLTGHLSPTIIFYYESE